MTMMLYGHSLIDVVREVSPIEDIVDDYTAQEEWSLQYRSKSYQLQLHEEQLTLYRMDGDYTQWDSSADRAICRFQHTRLLDIKRHLAYFWQHVERYIALSITPYQIELYIHYDVEECTVKESAQHKRARARLDLADLKYGLLFYQDGYVMDHHQGQVSVSNRKRFEIQGFGYEFNHEHSSRKALLEYLERCAATCELDGTIRGSYSEMGNQAIHPSRFGLYKRTAARLKSYTDDLEMNWVKARSLYTEAYYYLPEQLSQYLREDLLNQYVYESSNGCAIGQSLVEASLYAILEAVERDLFMKCWFYEQPLKRIVFRGDERHYLKGVPLYFQQLGYNITFYYMDNDMKLPAVWCLITSEKEGNSFYSITGLGCHLHIEHAIDAAFFEAVRSFDIFHKKEPQEIRAKIEEVERSQEIRHVMDHMYYFLSHQSKPLIEKRTLNRVTIAYEELEANSYRDCDLSNEMEEMMSRARLCYEDVLIVNQTNSFLRSLSLACTKALLLGAVPLDFTSHFIRSMQEGDDTDAKWQNKNIHPLA